MVRLIDADALLPMMKYATIDNEIGVFPIKIGFNAIAKVINEAPTVDAEPVRHGKWSEYPIADGMNQCSECGVLRFGCSNYCPNCGAKMDAERKEE